MDYLCKIITTLFFVGILSASITAINPVFDKSYLVLWGHDHVIPYKGSIVQLYMDKENGGAGFESKLAYGSGLFEMNIKVPGKESAGVVTAFYLASGNDSDHDELDFEFLGNRAGKPYTLQTNVIIDGNGDREQRFHLWFDPTAHFHTYKILWNEHHVVFFVDHIPIREFKNNGRFGVKYLTKPMKVEVSLWDGESWATDGGRTKTNWSFAPFKAYFDNFDINGCSINGPNIDPCNGDSTEYWWNNKEYSELNPTEEKGLRVVKDNYLNYDYCNDKQKHPVTPPECSHQ